MQELIVPSINEIFKDEMKKRSDFVEFFDNNINPTVLKNIDLLQKKVKENNSIGFIAGSRAWKYNLQQEPELYDLLSPIQKNSVLAGNYDLFIACPNEKDLNNILEQVCICIDSIMYTLNNSESNPDFQSNYELQYLSNVEPDEKKLKYPFYVKTLNKNCGLMSPLQTIGCISSLCKSMHLEITYKPLRGLIDPDKENIKEKVILYVECFLTTRNGIEVIQENILSESFLNWKGLFLFSEMIVKREKEYDIDSYRKEILDLYFQTREKQITKKDYFNSILYIYHEVFKNESPNFQSTMENLYKNYISLVYPDLVTSINGELIEKFRLFINSFVYKLDHLEVINNRTTSLFITGGDAYRRYLKDTKLTNDIDIKIFYTKHKQKILNSVIENICGLVVILYIYKSQILNELNNISLNETNDLTLQTLFDSGQFRIRYIRRETFTLISLDYKYRILLRSNVKLYYTLPIIDVVIQQNDHVISKKEYMIKYDNGIPIASPYYLKDDIYNIYNEISDNLKMRIPKSQKDIKRFKELVKYLDDNKKTLELEPSKGIKRKMENFLDKVEIFIDSNKKIMKDKEDDDYLIDDEEERLNKQFLQLLNDNDNSHLSRRFTSFVFDGLFSKNKDLINKYIQAFEKEFNNNKYTREKLDFNKIVEIYNKNQMSPSMEDLDNLFTKIEL